MAVASCAVLALGLLAACKPDNPEEGPGEPENPGPTAETVDKSDLAYVSSLDKYKKTDWSGAKWIWADRTTANSYVAFRKTFELDGAPKTAVADIAAESKYYLWVNGELVVYDGASKRGATLYDGFYEQVDLADYLVKGENTIVILVGYNGRSGNSSVDPGAAGLLFELNADDVTIV